MLHKKWITKNQNTRLYQIPVPIIGLTGGIATGKSTVAELFEKNNIPIIDADKLVKNIYQKNETIQFIKNNFPDVIENNTIVFSKLREKAFSNVQVKTKLEDYIYALMPQEFLLAFSKFPTSSYIIYDVPLLFEKGLDKFLDATICVYITKEMQIDRLIRRDGIDANLAKKMLDQQINIEDKKDKADLVVNNVGSLEQLQAEFKRVLLELQD